MARHPARYGLVLVGAILALALPPIYSILLIAGVALVLVLLAQPYVSLCALNPGAVNWNKNGSYHYGILLINSRWYKVLGADAWSNSEIPVIMLM